MQYNELLLAQTATDVAHAVAEAARTELTDLYDCAPVAYTTLNAASLVAAGCSRSRAGAQASASSCRFAGRFAQ